MTRQEFLNRLWELLADVTHEERDEALRFYNEYFDEAGPEQEQELIKELGSPEKVASIIRTNVPGSSAQPNYYSSAIAKPIPAYAGPKASYTSEHEPFTMPAAKNNNWVWAMIVILVVLAPALIGVAAGFIGLAMGLFGAVVGLIAGGLFCGIYSIMVIVKGALSIHLGAGTAFITMGFGFLELAAGFAMIAVSLWMVLWLIPGLWKGIKWCWNKIMNWIKGRAQ